MDAGPSYFEGATIEREYEKKLKGQTNVYDRLKCRPILRNRRENDDGSHYRLYNSSIRRDLDHLFSVIAVIFWYFYIFI
jgi:hypothetical protein